MPSPTRSLVLGATGFLGGAVAQALLDRGDTVSALVRGKPIHSEFVRTRLYDKCNLAGGIIEDINRLRQVLALHEIDCVYQCAAGGTVSETHMLTEFALQAIARCGRTVRMAVPLDESSRVRFTAPPNGLQVQFVKLPMLFGPGQLNPTWTASLFMAAAQGRPMPMPIRDVNVLDVHSAATALIAEVEPEPLGTSRELYACLNDAGKLRVVRPLDEPARQTLEWYRSTTHWQGRMPTPLRAVA